MEVKGGEMREQRNIWKVYITLNYYFCNFKPAEGTTKMQFLKKLLA